jgi:hypothetical protein
MINHKVKFNHYKIKSRHTKRLVLLIKVETQKFIEFEKNNDLRNSRPTGSLKKTLAEIWTIEEKIYYANRNINRIK